MSRRDSASYSHASATRRPRSRRSAAAMTLRFVQIAGRPDVARVQLLLCNISDQPLQYKLKTSSDGTHISAIPSATGIVPAHNQTRCTLTWQRPEDVSTWANVEAPKMLLITRIADEPSDSNSAETAPAAALAGSSVARWRLLAHVAPSRFTCPENAPPVEQLIIDASTAHRSAFTSPLSPAVSPPITPSSPVPPPAAAVASTAAPVARATAVTSAPRPTAATVSPSEPSSDVAAVTAATTESLIAELTPPQLTLLLVALAILFVALYNSVTRPK